MQDLFNLLKSHEYVDHFNQPIDQNHPNFEEYKDSLTTLDMIEMSFKCDLKYKTTDDVLKDITKMIMVRMQMSINTGDSNYQKIQSFYNMFNKAFSGLENQSLIKSVQPFVSSKNSFGKTDS